MRSTLKQYSAFVKIRDAVTKQLINALHVSPVYVRNMCEARLNALAMVECFLIKADINLWKSRPLLHVKRVKLTVGKVAELREVEASELLLRLRGQLAAVMAATYRGSLPTEGPVFEVMRDSLAYLETRPETVKIASAALARPSATLRYN